MFKMIKIISRRILSTLHRSAVLWRRLRPFITRQGDVSENSETGVTGGGKQLKGSRKKSLLSIEVDKRLLRDYCGPLLGLGLDVYNTLFLSVWNGLEPHHFIRHKGIGEKSTAALSLLERAINNIPAWRVGEKFLDGIDTYTVLMDHFAQTFNPLDIAH